MIPVNNTMKKFSQLELLGEHVFERQFGKFFSLNFLMVAQANHFGGFCHNSPRHIWYTSLNKMGMEFRWIKVIPRLNSTFFSPGHRRLCSYMYMIIHRAKCTLTYTTVQVPYTSTIV